MSLRTVFAWTAILFLSCTQVFSAGQTQAGRLEPVPLERLREIVRQRLEPRDLESFREIWPVGVFSPADLEFVRLRPPGSFQAGIHFLAEFRIVNWNAGAESGHENGPISAEVIAAIILNHVLEYEANVLTLQELRADVYAILVKGLQVQSLLWTCHAHVFGADRDFRVTCVKGSARNFRAVRLDDLEPIACTATEIQTDECLKNREWWGYTQVDYFGITITNVHTRSAWDRQHANQLHEEVQTGIVAGDFNRQHPEVVNGGADWFQTDVNLQPTWIDHNDNDTPKKTDHVLTVEPHSQAAADTPGFYGSSHMMVRTRFRMPVPLTALGFTRAEP